MGLHFGIYSVSPKKDDSPFTPFVYIEFKEYTKDKTGRVLLSAQLMTDQEVDYCIDGLIEELEKVRSQAKRALIKNEWIDARRP